MGRLRRRLYPRKFDWLEARARYAAGESGTALAKEYGVNKAAVYKVLKMPESAVAKATDADKQRLAELLIPKGYDACPRCERPKTRESALCRDCFNETRLDAETRIENIPGERRVVLADVAVGRIVRHAGRWGVVVQGGSKSRSRLVDFWDGGREYVSDIAIVEVAPGQRVLVGGVEEAPEEIAA